MISQCCVCCVQMLVDWLRERMQEGRPAGRYLMLLYLVRGRVPEALSAHRELLKCLPEGQRAGAAVLHSASVCMCKPAVVCIAVLLMTSCATGEASLLLAPCQSAAALLSPMAMAGAQARGLWHNEWAMPHISHS